ncbi:MAG: helix-turn-helix domain-containing protein [Bdellovibrionaceae bacterium]|nr:helix-turn-helix domain-containing protein [Pseudobdellovibrionaceae bacterium]
MKKQVEGLAGECYSSSQIFENTKAWLNTKEAAEYLGLTPNALRIKVSRGAIRAFKLGNRLRFKIKDLRSVLKYRGG